jgi:hypothetical protein
MRIYTNDNGKFFWDRIRKEKIKNDLIAGFIVAICLIGLYLLTNFGG